MTTEGLKGLRFVKPVDGPEQADDAGVCYSGRFNLSVQEARRPNLG